MPNGDGTGPEGKGPMTGRGAGLCGGNSGPGRMHGGPGRGMGCGKGAGRMRRGMRPMTEGMNAFKAEMKKGDK